MTMTSQAFTLQEIAVRCGVEPDFVQQLVEHGIIDAHPRGAAGLSGQFSGEGTFSSEVSIRVQRCSRLQRDLGVNLEGAGVIFELLDRIESLEHELRALRRR